MASQNQNTSKREEKGKNIQVVVRCRPFNTVERKTSYGVVDCDQSRKEVLVRTGGLNEKASRKTYTFDMVFGAAAKQIDVYRSVVCPILDEVIMGYNCTVFAYGQTGTGKTFTMEGERSPGEEFTWEEDPLAGIIPRTLHQIFEKLSENGTEFSVKVSLLEIYNEELFDLLSPTEDVTGRLQLFDDPRNKRGVVVKGLEEVMVHNKDEVYQILERGSAKRRTASTLMNSCSSRSHSVFSVTIHMKEMTLDGEELVKIGKLNLVDLAGSENIGRSGAVDKRAREAGNINQSLLTLGRVITALVEKRPHVPYRESKLTRILQDSLGGRTKTSIIATVSPSSSNLEETMSTLDYASRAKNIMNEPEVNQKLTKRTLIKEYTKEIERLKRDLAATREKNGVYLSAENYESMMSQITVQDEHVTESTERIAAMEEELKKITELFTDSKSRLEQCTTNLDLTQQRLKETNRDLEETKEKLNQEEFVSSELSSVQEVLYSTAGQLLTTVESSTKDVSGLHEKLDRKTKVEHHNRQIMQSFHQRMDEAFSGVQRNVQQQGATQQHMINSCRQAVDELLLKNQAALGHALSAMETQVGGVRRLMSEGVVRLQERVQQQEALCQQDKEGLQQLLDEHRQHMEEVLMGGTLPGLSAVKDLIDSLKASMETQRVLADKVEALKDTAGFFRTLLQDLAGLRETAVQGVEDVQKDHKRLEQEILSAQHRHQDRHQQMVQLLQNQLNLMAVETEQDFSHLCSASRTLEEPLKNLQQNINSGSRSIEERGQTQVELLSTTCSSLASSLRLHSKEEQQKLEELTSCSTHIHSAVSGLVDWDLRWTSGAVDQAERRARDHSALIGKSCSDAHTLQQNLDEHCSEQLSTTKGALANHKEELQRSVKAIQEQTTVDWKVLEQQRAELEENLEGFGRLVSGFLQEELQQDVPTGTTPQRRQFVYPEQLVKSRSRTELLDSLRKNQEELLNTMEEEEEPEEEEEEVDKHSLVEQDLPEDELSSFNERATSEQSFMDENLVFDEAKRVPFFKQKKGGKKKSKIPGRVKVLEDEAAASPQRSKLPLRCIN